MNRGSFIRNMFGAVAAVTIGRYLPTTTVTYKDAAKVAPYARVSKQFMANLPFLQETLPRLLLRDLQEKEDEEFINMLNR